MKCRVFWKWSVIFWITLLTIQITGCVSLKAVYAQSVEGADITETEEPEMQTGPEFLTGALDDSTGINSGKNL